MASLRALQWLLVLFAALSVGQDCSSTSCKYKSWLTFNATNPIDATVSVRLV